MRAFSSWGLLIMFLGAGLTGCGPLDEEEIDGGRVPDGGGISDGRAPDTTIGAAYKWIAIFDEVAVPSVAMCMATSGPGADIDSVDLVRGGSVIGVGLRGSALFSATQTGGATNSPCTGCGRTMATCMHSGAQVAPRAEGPQDGMSFADRDDIGYIALNAGLLWLKIGQANGNSPEQEIRSGDTVIVREVDRWYVATGDAFATCDCLPEKYAVYAYVEMANISTRVQLRATTYKMQNAETCGASPGNSLLGCGTTEFTVP